MALISDEIFFPELDPPALLGGRSKTSGEYKFPFPLGSERVDYEPVPLAREGKLWTYTIQRFPPARPYVGVTDPEHFKPFALGYVELADQIIVETHMLVDDFSALRIGMEMELATAELPRGDSTGTFMTYAFRQKGNQS